MTQKMERIRPIRMMNMCMIEDDQGNVLVLNKVNNSYTGITFPGGHIEKGESYADSMIREVREETGLVIEQPMLMGIYHWEKDEAEHIVLLYKADRYAGILHSSEEGQVFWLPKEEFLNQKLAIGMDRVWKLMHSNELNECHMVRNGENYTPFLY